MITERCPCGNPLPFEQCCAPFLQGFKLPDSAEQLMRSRYTAFATGAVDYLIETHYRDQRNPADREQLQASIDQTQWLGLIILACQQGTSSDHRGKVEFAAYYRDDRGEIGQLHERSRFVREDRQWLYVDGDILPPVQTGRNEPCWCGSGRKFKKCHGA